jgi:hypothetical protein
MSLHASATYALVDNICAVFAVHDNTAIPGHLANQVKLQLIAGTHQDALANG